MKRPNSQKVAFRIGLFTAGALLIVGSALSGIGVVLARQQGYEQALLWLGLLTVTFWFAALVCVGVKILHILEDRTRRLTPPTRASCDAEYVAEYSLRDRAIGLVLTAFFGALLAYLALRSTRVTGIAISAGFFCFFAWYTLQLMLTRVTFTREQIVARLPLFRRFSEPYSRVVRLQGKTGTLLLHFADGQRLKLHSGLGDLDVILAYLQSHCPGVAER